MSKEPHKDPFENLPKPRLFEQVQTETVLDHYGPNDRGFVSAKPTTTVVVEYIAPAPEKIEKAKAAIAAAKSKRGPKKGSGGRPKKAGPVAKRTEQHRRKKKGDE